MLLIDILAMSQPVKVAIRAHKAASNRGVTMVLQLKQHLLELRQTQESLQEQTHLCNAQEEEIVAIQAECVPELFWICAHCTCII